MCRGEIDFDHLQLLIGGQAILPGLLPQVDQDCFV